MFLFSCIEKDLECFEGRVEFFEFVRNSHLGLSSLVRSDLMALTHVRIKGQTLNFYFESHATPHNVHTTPHNIYFIRLRILPRILGTFKK